VDEKIAKASKDQIDFLKKALQQLSYQRDEEMRPPSSHGRQAANNSIVAAEE
jgi:hypothetical protein